MASSSQTNYTATGNDSNTTDPASSAAGTGQVPPAISPLAASLYAPLAPRTAASFPNFVHPDVWGYANLFAQMQDAMGNASRYSQSPFWGNGAGRYAYGSGVPYGNPAGRNAPWTVGGGAGYPGQGNNPQGGLLGQPRIAVDPSLGSSNGLLGGGSPNGLTAAPSAPAAPPPAGAGPATAQSIGMSLQPGLLPSGSQHYAINQAGQYKVGDINPRTQQPFSQYEIDAMNPGNAQMVQQWLNATPQQKSAMRYQFPTFFRNMLSSGNASFQDDLATQPGSGY